MCVHQSLAQGNVTVEVRNGELRVTGQNNMQHDILVTQGFAPGEYLFSDPEIGMNLPTTFNGQEALTVSGVTTNARFDLKSGQKTLIFNNIPFPNSSFPEGADPVIRFPGNLRISNSGSQRAIVIMNNLEVAGSTEVSTKNGMDAILMVDSLFLGNIKLNTGGGNDVVLQAARIRDSGGFGRLECSLGSGNDQYLMAGIDIFGAASFKLGGGNDSLAFTESAILGGTEVNGNGGFDCVVVDEVLETPSFSIRSIEDLQNIRLFSDVYSDAKDNPSFDLAEEIFIELVGF
jgi:hypothetical protein